MEKFNDSDAFERAIKKYLNGTATPEEIKFVETYYDIFKWRNEITNHLSDEEIFSIQQRIENRLFSHISESELPKVRSMRFKAFRWIAAASVILLVGLGWLNYNKSPKKPSHVEEYVEADILPGGNKAVLILADGSKILLDTASNGIISFQGDVSVSKTEEGQLKYDGKITSSETVYNEISTPAGGQYKLLLSDGSKVWLNALSSLRFPVSFNGSERRVFISGEVYFEVAKAGKPFRVSIANKQEVLVLGTHFNINSYDNEGGIKTTLLEGSVQVSSAIKNYRPLILEPGQQAHHTESGELNLVHNINLDEVMAWKNGLFQFDNTDLRAVMRRLARWYNVEIQYEGNVPNRKFSGKIHRNVNASQVLDILTFTGVHFRIEKSSIADKPDKIIVTP